MTFFKMRTAGLRIVAVLNSPPVIGVIQDEIRMDGVGDPRLS